MTTCDHRTTLQREQPHCKAIKPGFGVLLDLFRTCSIAVPLRKGIRLGNDRKPS